MRCIAAQMQELILLATHKDTDRTGQSEAHEIHPSATTKMWGSNRTSEVLRKIIIPARHEPEHRRLHPPDPPTSFQLAGQAQKHG
jgi:hypothetical protein